MLMRNPNLCQRILLGLAILILFLGAPGIGHAQEWKHRETIMVRPGAPGTPDVSTQDAGGGREVLTVRFKSFEIWEARHLNLMYIQPDFPGCGYEGKVGDPSTPIWTKIIQSIPGERVMLEGVECDWYPQEIYGRWLPQTPYVSDFNRLPALKVNQKTYQSKIDIFESGRVTLTEPRRIWNTSYLAVVLRPYCYFPGEGRIKLLKEARISLRRVGGPKDRSAGTEKVVKGHGGYVVITPEKFLKALKPFLDFKRKQHPDLEVFTLEKIGSKVEEIDRVIEREGSRGTRFFLLVGHSSVLPAQPYKGQWAESDKPECHDGDFVYRNRSGDDFPCYRIGRFPVTTEAELEVVVAKTLARWRNPNLFQTRPMLIAHEEEAPRKYQGCITSILQSVVPQAKTKLTPRMILPASPGKGGLGSRKQDFYDGLQSGVGVMLYRGHGGTDFLASELLGYWGSRQKHWYELKSAIPPVLFSVACLNGQMTDADGKPVPGLCANLVNAYSYGAAAAVGAILPSPTIPNHTFAWNLMYFTYVEPQPTMGDILHHALLATMKYGFSAEKNTDPWLSLGYLYNLYGDPELPVTSLKKTR